jgi:hypothetical protein
MTDRPVCRQDFDADFEAMTAGLKPGYDGPAYAFTRYGDGEAAIMRGRRHVAKSDGWVWPADPAVARDDENRGTDTYDETKLPTQLWLAMTEDVPGWYVGVTAEEHHPDDHDWMVDWVFDDRGHMTEDRVTFAELFIFANHARFKALDLRHCRIVGPRQHVDPFLRVPRDAITSGWDWRPLVDYLIRGQASPIVVAAGPLAKVLIHDYWLRCPLDRRQVIIDAGSAISHLFGSRPIRTYQKGGPQSQWRPKWSLTDSVPSP